MREQLTIGYEFEFKLAVRKKNGKLYKNHHIIGLGISFGLALWDVFFKLKRRQSVIVEIRAVRPLRVAFAFNYDSNHVKTSIAEHPPEIPEDLSGVLQTFLDTTGYIKI